MTSEKAPLPLASGTPETKQFYDDAGWHEADGRTYDSALFGVREDGPIRRAAHALRVQRVREALGGPGLDLLEAGCGGNPEFQILDLCASYTGVDFSTTGIERTRAALEKTSLRYRLKVADITALPFEDLSFDAVYCAHVLYHIADANGQAQALREILRVLRPGGAAVLLVANPRPLAFPLTLARRLVADTPFVSAVANKLRKQPPLPYKPMPIGWTMRRLRNFGKASVSCYAIASTGFNHRVSEISGVGRVMWRVILWLEREFPKLSARLGCYVQISVRKHAPAE